MSICAQQIKNKTVKFTARRKNMKKKILPMALALATFCTSISALADYTFKDIEEEQYSWCAPQIQDMYEAGYINGYEDGTYRPDATVTKLECIALFARVMGASDENNDDVLALAHEQYDSAIKSSSLPWGEDEIVYMMYKGAFTAADLITYINGDEKNKPMTRGEAAVIITKAMGGEDGLSNDPGVSLHYKDAREIPTNILQYVKYVTDQEIMNGIDDAFCADGTVTRSQIAVMLSRVAKKCDYSFKKARIDSIDEETSTIVYTPDGEDQIEYTYTNDTDFYVKGEKTQVSSMPENVSALVQYSGDDVVMFDAMSSVADEEISVIYSGYNASSTFLKINVKDDENSQSVRTFTCDVDVPITYAGSPSTIKALKSGDAVVLSLSDGKVVAIKAVEKIEEIKNVSVSDININGSDVTMTIESSEANYNDKKYPVSETVSVTKNGKASDMTNIYIGDKVNLKVKYGTIISIDATAVNSTVEGVLTKVSIGETTEITLNVGGKNVTYQVPVNCSIEKNGEASDIYALRLNDSLKLTVQSGAVLTIRTLASNTVSSDKISGTVTAVNQSYKFVAVLTDGSSTPINVNVNANTKYTVVRGGGSASLTSIGTGDRVECYVSISNGAYVATDIVIEKASK